jgi:hypothetical protein
LYKIRFNKIIVTRGREGPQYGKLFYGCFKGKRRREVRATLRKTIFEFALKWCTFTVTMATAAILKKVNIPKALPHEGCHYC